MGYDAASHCTHIEYVSYWFLVSNKHSTGCNTKNNPNKGRNGGYVSPT